MEVSKGCKDIILGRSTPDVDDYEFHRWIAEELHRRGATCVQARVAQIVTESSGCTAICSVRLDVAGGQTYEELGVWSSPSDVGRAVYLAELQAKCKIIMQLAHKETKECCCNKTSEPAPQAAEPVQNTPTQQEPNGKNGNQYVTNGALYADGDWNPVDVATLNALRTMLGFGGDKGIDALGPLISEWSKGRIKDYKGITQENIKAFSVFLKSKAIAKFGASMVEEEIAKAIRDKMKHSRIERR